MECWAEMVPNVLQIYERHVISQCFGGCTFLLQKRDEKENALFKVCFQELQTRFGQRSLSVKCIKSSLNASELGLY